jgi:hypothetical protein
MEEQIMLKNLYRFKHLHSGWQGPGVTQRGVARGTYTRFGQHNAA